MAAKEQAEEDNRKALHQAAGERNQRGFQKRCCKGKGTPYQIPQESTEEATGGRAGQVPGEGQMQVIEG